MRHSLWLVLVALFLTACAGGASAGRTVQSSATTTPAAATTTPAASVTPSPRTPTTTAARTSRAVPSTTTTVRRPSPTSTAPARAAAPAATPKPKPKPAGLKGDKRNALAFAPLSNPSAVTIEGSVPSSRAWSTSKVLVVAAFLDTVVDGDPSRLTSKQRTQITRALTESHMESLIALRAQIPGSPGAAITAVLRSVGDKTTVAPDRSQGSMQWTIRQQVRFMAALDAGKVVSPASSAHILKNMQPIKAHRWGLGTIGAGPFKGGWLRSDTETRQMGIVDGYAVAIITAGVGPAVVQTDGDAAHVKQMNYLAGVLKRRLAAE
jgi:hypothetical protein